MCAHPTTHTHTCTNKRTELKLFETFPFLSFIILNLTTEQYFSSFHQNLILKHVYGCFPCICLYTPCLTWARKEQKRAPNTLKLQFQMAVSFHLSAVNRSWILWKNSQCFYLPLIFNGFFQNIFHIQKLCFYLNHVKLYSLIEKILTYTAGLAVETLQQPACEKVF